MASRSEHYLRRKAKKQQMRRLRLLDRATEGNEGGKNMIKNYTFKNVITNRIMNYKISIDSEAVITFKTSIRFREW